MSHQKIEALKHRFRFQNVSGIVKSVKLHIWAKRTSISSRLMANECKTFSVSVWSSHLGVPLRSTNMAAKNLITKYWIHQFHLTAYKHNAKITFNWFKFVYFHDLSETV